MTDTTELIMFFCKTSRSPGPMITLWEELKVEQHSIKFTEIDYQSPVGAALAKDHNIQLSPTFVNSKGHKLLGDTTKQVLLEFAKR